MQTTIKKFGSYASISTAVLFTCSLYFGQELDFSVQEVLGYATIIISLLFVFFGIKHFRDKKNNGFISFKKAITIGILISLCAALTFAVIDVFYVGVINHDFSEQYLNYSLENFKNTLSTEDYLVKKAELEAQMKLFNNPTFTGVVMFATVFIIGFIISLLSSLLLQRKKTK